MNAALPQDFIDKIARNEHHSADAEQAFFQAWKRGVAIAGPAWFGEGIHHPLAEPRRKSELRPRVLDLSDALGTLSGGERLFLSALVSFYNAREGGAMLQRCGFNGLADLGRLDPERRQVIADLLVHYDGW